MNKKNKIIYSNKRRIRKYTRILSGILVMLFGIWLLNVWKDAFLNFLKGLAVFLIIIVAISLIFLSWAD
jgi:uncharacterized membrane protein YkgB